MFGLFVAFKLFVRTKFGRKLFDRFQMKMPVLGPVVSKVAISRFTSSIVCWTPSMPRTDCSTPRTR